MKNYLFITIASLMIAGCAFGCSDKSSSSGSENKADESITTTAEVSTVETTTDVSIEELIEGKWECSEIITDGESVKEMYDVPVSAVMRFEFGSDGKAVCSNALSSEKMAGTWKASGDDTFEFSAESSASFDKPVEFKRDGSGIVTSQQQNGKSSELHFKKVAEFTKFDAAAYQREMSKETTTSAE